MPNYVSNGEMQTFFASSRWCPKLCGTYSDGSESSRKLGQVVHSQQHSKTHSDTPPKYSSEVAHLGSKRQESAAPKASRRSWRCGPDANALAQIQVFDPGIPDVDEDSELVFDADVALVKHQGVRPMSCREGELKVGTDTVKFFNVLFDTGT